MTNSLELQVSKRVAQPDTRLFKVKEATDRYGRKITIWKTSSDSIIGVVLLPTRKFVVLRQSQIINPLVGPLSTDVFDNIYNNLNFHLVFDPDGNNIVIWPKLMAGADPSSVSISGDRAPLQITSELNKLRHMFSGKFFSKQRGFTGHFPQDTPEARQIIRSATVNQKYCIGRDSRGHEHYKRILPDGSQAWAKVRNGVIVEGIRNDQKIYKNESVMWKKTIKDSCLMNYLNDGIEDGF